jgi:cytochrome c-type biogenesis protein CcmF
VSSASIGSYSILLAFLAAMVGILAAVAYASLGDGAFLRACRWALGITAGFLTVALAALTAAFLGDKFRIAYVAEYSERALPWGYKLAAVWAGQEGSFLLWAWILAVMAWVASWTVRKEPGIQQAATGGILSAVCAAFASLLLFGASPFELAKVAAADGGGLNPMLQDPAMIAHPPVLFAGYAAFAIPFALLLAALIARRTDNAWVFRVRRWTLGAWVLLTIGIFLGSWWAYIELGWGGYWAWDPVENASLLPWLTGTWAMHTLISQQRRGTLRVLSALFVVASFLLCLVGSYLTRSGVIQSVHAFPESSVGWFFLGMIGAGLFGAMLVMAMRLRLLRSGPPLTRIVSMEGAFIAGAALMLVITGTILVGTIYPLLSRPVAAVVNWVCTAFPFFGSPTARPTTLDQKFYNSVVVPMALVLTALMATGPLLSTLSSPGRLVRRLILGAVGAIHGIVVAVLVYDHNPWMVVTLAIVGFAAFTIFDDVVRTLLRPLGKGGGGLAGVWRAFSANGRRFAGLLTHAGMAMLVLGVAGSSLFGVSQDLALLPGESAKVAPDLLRQAKGESPAPGDLAKARSYTLRLDSAEEVRHSNFGALEATITVSMPAGREIVLRPQRRKYDKSSMNNTEVALRCGLGEDLYVILRGMNENGQTVLTVLVNPLVSWIWIGSIVMAVGAGLCVLYRAPKRVEPAQPRGGQEAPAKPKGMNPPPLRQR